MNNRRLNILILFCLLFVSFGCQKDNKIAPEEDETFRKKIHEMATAFPDSANSMSVELWRKIDSLRTDKFTADVLSTLAWVKIWNNNPDSAEVYNNRSFIINSELKNTNGIAFNLALKGKIAQNRSQFVDAVSFFVESNKLTDILGMNDLTQYNYRSISTVFLAQQNCEKCLEFAQKANSLNSKNSEILGDNFTVLANAYDCFQKPDSSIKYYSKANQAFRVSNNSFRLAYNLSQYSIVFEESEPLKSLDMELEAQVYLDKVAPENLISLGNLGNIGWGFFDLASNPNISISKDYKFIPKDKSLYIKLAEEYLIKTLALARKIKSPIHLQYYSNTLSEVYAFKNDYKKAYESLLIYKNFNDSLFSQKNKNALAKIAAEKDLLKLSSESQRKTLINYILGGILFGILVLIFFVLRNVKTKRILEKQEKLLTKQKIAELEKDKQLLAVDALLRGQEEERNRIAKDLHDGLGGMLSSVKMTFVNMKDNLIMDAENVKNFEKSIAQLDNTIAELRKVAHNLMPEALAKFGLKDAIRDFCNAMESSSQIKVIYQFFGEDRKIGNTAEVYIYRIIQELVLNAIKHAESTQIMVQVTLAEKNILLTVEDNGKGINHENQNKSKGIGLESVKQRVDYLNGKVEFDSNEPSGTVVNIELNV